MSQLSRPSVVIAGTMLMAFLHGHQTPVVAARATQADPKANGSELIAVTSRDGTRIGVECAGTGPTVLFVHGGVGDRTRWTPMFPLLASTFTSCAMDRRGRGASGDAPEYSLAKEAEDVAAVVNSRPGTVLVFGHSYGGVAALEATFLTDRIAALMLYEPPLHEPGDTNLAVAARLEQMIARGDLEQALVTFQTEIVKQSPEETARMQTRPSWAGLVATIRVHPRQMRALSAYRFDAARMKSVTMPTLLLIGEGTLSPYAKRSIAALRESLPDPTVVVLERQEHNAMDGGPTMLAEAIVRFATKVRPPTGDGTTANPRTPASTQGTSGMLAGTAWNAVELYGTTVAPEVAPPGLRPHLVFGADGRLSGADGCNRLTGPYTVEADGITFGQIAGTQMACAKTDEIVKRFRAALKGTGHWRLANDRLEFYGATGKPLAVFERRPEMDGRR